MGLTPMYHGVEDLAIWAHRVEKKYQLFGVFIGLSAAPWRADSKNVYMSIANIIASGSKM